MSKPLVGKRIVVTRSPDQAKVMCEKLEALGAIAIPFPVIEFVPLPAPELDKALANLADFDWIIFTSGNAVRFFWERLSAIPVTKAPLDNLRVAAVGSATNKLLAEKGQPIDFTPDEFTGEQLVLGLGDVSSQKILLPRARIGRPEIVNLLKEQGAVVSDISLYDTVTAEPTSEAFAELDKGFEVITFTSPSSVRNFLRILKQNGNIHDLDYESIRDRFRQILSGTVVACIGPSTAAEAEENGLSVDVIPEDYTIDALISAVADYFYERNEQS